MNKERLFALMKQEGIDAILASTPENVGYLTGFWMAVQQVARWLETKFISTRSVL